MKTAEEIVQRAIALGYDKCGVILLDKMKGYEKRLEERMAYFPENRKRYEKFRAFSHMEETYPWAKAVVVCSFWYGKYRIPERLQGHIAKYYLTDGRKDPASPGYQTSIAFESYLRDSGFQVKTERKFGLTALRWAAVEAGLGIMRKNNFFYTEKGSYQHLEAFLIDQPLEYLSESKVRPCSEKCDLCQKACPTGSLAAPYQMNRDACISWLTTWDDWNPAKEPLQDQMGDWIYGCDVCQDVCPYNQKAWSEEEAFPGLEELSQHLTCSEIVGADYDWLQKVLQPKFWYISKGKEWRYKTDVLHYICHHYSVKYLSIIQAACEDEREEVRKMARWVLEQVGEL